MNQRGLVVVMRPFKLRQINPPILLNGQAVPLTESGLDPAYAGLLKQHEQAMKRSYTAHAAAHGQSREAVAPPHGQSIGRQPHTDPVHPGLTPPRSYERSSAKGPPQ